MNRREMVMAYLMAEATARALKEALKNEARTEWVENETAASWRLPEANVSASISHDAFVVADPDAFHAWLAKAYPTEVKTVTVPRNPEWTRKLLDTLATASLCDCPDGTLAAHDAPQGSCVKRREVAITPDGTVVEGVVFEPGGRFITASVTPDPELKQRLAEAARSYALTGEPPDLKA